MSIVEMPLDEAIARCELIANDPGTDLCCYDMVAVRMVLADRKQLAGALALAASIMDASGVEACVRVLSQLAMEILSRLG